MAGINDTLRDSEGNFKVVSGDFVFSDASAIIISNILLSVPGHYKEFPTIGAGIINYVNTTANKQVITRDIKVALKADVFKKPSVDLTNFPSSVLINNFELELVQE